MPDGSSYYESSLEILAPRLSPDLIAKLHTKACSINEDNQEQKRERIIILLIPYLPQHLINKTLEIAREMNDKTEDNLWWKTSILIHLAAHSPQFILEAFDVTCSISAKANLNTSYLWEQLIPHLPEELLLKALEVILTLRFNSNEALKKLAPRLSQDLLAKAFIEDGKIKDSSKRARMLAASLSHLSQEMLLEYLEVIRSFKDPYQQSTAMQKLVKEFDFAEIQFSLWKEFLHTFSSQERSFLLQNIPQLAPGILILGGKRSFGDCAKAIQDVCSQWT